MRPTDVEEFWNFTKMIFLISKTVLENTKHGNIKVVELFGGAYGSIFRKQPRIFSALASFVFTYCAILCQIFCFTSV
jgi:hypothetical protein